MADAKIEFKVGTVSFTGEGDAAWLSQQLDKVLEKIPKLFKVLPAPDENGAQSTGTAENGAVTGVPKTTGTLAAFLKAKDATSNQVRKFLATALWLHDVGDKKRLTTSDITKALKDNNQGTLSNASQCLVQNTKQGSTEKDGKKQFYVTDEGRTELG